jgi:hypothetical protein
MSVQNSIKISLVISGVKDTDRKSRFTQCQFYALLGEDSKIIEIE